MLFNSFDFIFYFLPITFIGYFLLNKFGRYQWANLFLTLASIFFYGYNNPSYVWIIISSIVINYIVHLVLSGEMARGITSRKCILTAGILANIGILFYFKYFNFALEIVTSITGKSITFSQIALPLGISFFTFQQIGFIVDSYKKAVPKQDIVSYALFVTFFPQLVAGPIVNHDEMLPQFANPENKSPKATNIYLGVRAFIYGLAKKILIADVIGLAVNWGYNYAEYLDCFNTILVIILYSLQLYFDFSGYCDMARGLGYFFNIKIALNFNSPFKSKNLVEFWKRWHMTLGRFFTRYLYIPLGGNHKGFARALLNVFIVFVVSGIWHGAGWTFIVWGLMHAFMQIITRLWWRAKQSFGLPEIRNAFLKGIVNVLSVIGCFGFVAFAFGIFRADSLAQFGVMLGNLSKFNGIQIMPELANYFCLKEVSYVLRLFNLDTINNIVTWQAVLFLAITVFMTWGCKNITETEENTKPSVIQSLGLAVLFVWSVLSLSGVSTFLYFNF